MPVCLGVPSAGGRLKEVVHEKESGVLFFVFEYMPDGNLFTKLRSFPEGMPEEQVRDILYVVMGGHELSGDGGGGCVCGLL